MAHGSFTFEMDKKDQRKLDRILSGLEEVDKNEAVQTALKSGMQMIVNQGKANLSLRNKKKTGNLSRSFSIRVYKKKQYTLGGFRRSAPRKGIVGGNHSYLVDRGTGLRWTKSGAFRGAALGSMFWTDAVESQGPVAQAGLLDSINKAVTDIIDRNTH